jgi:3-phosphoshikimate 1-carboxyvinyltransferase
MRRIIEPLEKFGAVISARDGNFLPMTIQGKRLRAIDYTLPVASAQVKSAVLLAGLQAEGLTRVVEPAQTRNHTEIALKQFGASLEVGDRTIELLGGQRLTAQSLTVPGDVSSAAFFVAAALGAPNGTLRIRDVGLNPTRTGFIELLEDMGARIVVEDLSLRGGEPVGNLVVQPSILNGGEIGGHWIGNVIDEIPILAVLGARTRSGIRIRDAAELRVKESDRIKTVAENLMRLGVQVEEYEDGLFVPGEQTIKGGTVDSYGDHRIAMSFAIAGLFARDPVTIENAQCVAVSFPGFFDLLRKVAQP